jgi:hypothetical protein
MYISGFGKGLVPLQNLGHRFARMNTDLRALCRGFSTTFWKHGAFCGYPLWETTIMEEWNHHSKIPFFQL